MAVTKLDLANREPRGQAVASQATHIESARAVAQVQGALVVAQQRPRDEIRAAARMREACATPQLADRAFFSFPRGRERVAGPSIHLATELARCWGNVDYGITELSRGEGQSEMQAYAWDLETNARVTNSFIAPHVRDTSSGPKPLTDKRDIYENNANLGARRLRECIFRVLPVAFREEAEAICRETLENGGGEPIERRRVALLEAFAKLGVSRKRIERRVGRPADQLTPFDLGTLRVVYQTIRRGEATAAEEFPDDGGGEAMQELRPQQEPKAPPPEAPPAELPLEPQPGGPFVLYATDGKELGRADNPTAFVGLFDKAWAEDRKGLTHRGNLAALERLAAEARSQVTRDKAHDRIADLREDLEAVGA